MGASKKRLSLFILILLFRRVETQQAMAPHPLDDGGLVRTACWRWLTPFLWYNYWHRTAENPLLMADLWDAPRDTRSVDLAREFRALWHDQRDDSSAGWRAPPGSTSNTPPYGRGRFLRILIRLYFWRWIGAGTCYILWCACALLQPEIIALTVAHLTSASDTATTTTLWHGVAYAVSLLLCGIGYAWSINATFTILVRFGTQIKATMQSVLFDKALRLHVSSENADVGAWITSFQMTRMPSSMFEIPPLPVLVHDLRMYVLGMMIRTVSLVPALCGFGTLLLVLRKRMRVSKSVSASKA